LLKPLYILTLGATALHALLPDAPTITEARGQIWDSWLSDSLVYPTYHPAATIYDKTKLADFRRDVSDFAALVKIDLGIHDDQLSQR